MAQMSPEVHPIGASTGTLRDQVMGWLAPTELVGQEKADKAIALAERVRARTASLIRAAAEAVDPGPDQREELAEAKATIERREKEINLLNDTITNLKIDIAKLQNTLSTVAGATDTAKAAEASAKVPAK